MKEEKTEMKVGDKVRFTKGYKRMPFMFGLDSTPASMSSSPKVFTIEGFDEVSNSIFLKEDFEPRRRMAPEWLELVKE